MKKALLSFTASVSGVALAHAQPFVGSDAPLYAYRLAYSKDGLTATVRVDPSRPPGERVEILSPRKRKKPGWLSDAVAELDAEADPALWCSSYEETIPKGAVIERKTDGVAIYAFDPIILSDDPEERLVMAHLEGRVTRSDDDGEILHYVLSSRAPFKMSRMIRVDRFTMDVVCKRSPDGRTYVAETRSQTAGKASGFRFEELESQYISDLERVSNTSP
ncbi:MAG: hypothetical protein AAGA09_03970 [Pseudomonadota bacterium]